MTESSMPRSISRADYVRLIESVGFDPQMLASLRFDALGIYAEVYQRTAGPEVRFFVENGEAVRNTVFIPVKDEDGAA